jgi:hypothetical protein
MRLSRFASPLTIAVTAALVAVPAVTLTLQAQQVTQPEPRVARLVAEPARVNLKVGDSVAFKVTAYDSSGKVLPNAAVRVGGPRMAVYFGDGIVRGLRAGSFKATATAGVGFGAPPVTLDIPVTITWPALASVEVTSSAKQLYTGATVAHTAKGFHADKSERKGLAANWRSSDASIARVDRFGNVTALKPGNVTITAEADGVRGEKRYAVAANPVTTVELDIKESSIRTGDVVHLEAIAKRANGSVVEDAPITWSYTYTPDDSIVAPGGPGIIDQAPTGTVFAGNYGGRYTIMGSPAPATPRRCWRSRRGTCAAASR